MQSKTCPAKLELNRCCRGVGAVLHLGVYGDRFAMVEDLLQTYLAIKNRCRLSIRIALIFRLRIRENTVAWFRGESRSLCECCRLRLVDSHLPDSKRSEFLHCCTARKPLRHVWKAPYC